MNISGGHPVTDFLALFGGLIRKMNEKGADPRLGKVVNVVDVRA